MLTRDLKSAGISGVRTYFEIFDPTDEPMV